MEMREIPYLEIQEIAEKNRKIRQEVDVHDKKYPTINGERVFIPPLSKEELDKHFEKHPEKKEHQKAVEEWRKEWGELMHSIEPDVKDLSPEQLELLGINFDVYEHKYNGSKAYISIKGKRMEVTPEFGKVETE
jgi:hypothetical protein